MLRYPKSLLAAAGALLLSLGSIGAGAAPSGEPAVVAPESAFVRVQYNDLGRCYNSCVAGRIFGRCQADARFDNKENCCNVACNRLNNDNSWPD